MIMIIINVDDITININNIANSIGSKTSSTRSSRSILAYSARSLEAFAHHRRRRRSCCRRRRRLGISRRVDPERLGTVGRQARGLGFAWSALWGSLFRAVLEHSCSICKSLSSLWLRARVVLALCSGAVDLVTTFTGTEASRGVSSAARVARQSEPSGLLGPE